MEPKHIGVILALLSSISIGSSFVLTKIGLNHTIKKYGSATKDIAYLKNYIWWIGMLFMAIGEFANFAAYSFAPAILVTPLGALSVIIGAILASIFLGERISNVGKAGCALCILGSLQVIVNSPEDPPISSVQQIMTYIQQPSFIIYAAFNFIAILLLLYVFSPKYGQKTPIIYLSICSIAGSFTVVACKALGIAIKLTLSGNNQMKYFSTYFFMLSVASCIVIQLGYFNKALELFNTNVVTPIYYVLFTTLTIVATTILFKGFSGTPEAFISIICGFFTLFIGVYLLNSTKATPKSYKTISDEEYSSLFDLEEISAVDLDRNRTKTVSEDSDSIHSGYTPVSTYPSKIEHDTPVIFEVDDSIGHLDRSSDEFADNLILRSNPN
ncbi:hypothetical protein BB560_003749 [Smittium megazygosporum]|uniref:Magnesium transporter n=1 Tax=Smittium megazygosporum TaxID=133381 RepID=A0A2T9ZB85_9FUNG|nr:hypothetical protein BB560_003749 [Smittium megazygosporum]